MELDFLDSVNVSVHFVPSLEDGTETSLAYTLNLFEIVFVARSGLGYELTGRQLTETFVCFDRGLLDLVGGSDLADWSELTPLVKPMFLESYVLAPLVIVLHQRFKLPFVLSKLLSIFGLLLLLPFPFAVLL